MKHRAAVVIEDQDKDGYKDLSIYANDRRILTIYNLKKLGIEALGTFAAVFCALVGHGLVM